MGDPGELETRNSKLGTSACVRPSSRTAYQILDGLAVLVAIRERTVHRLDGVGTDLWTFLEPGRTVAEVIDFLLETYEVDPETARLDVTEFLSTLAEQKLIEVTA